MEFLRRLKCTSYKNIKVVVLQKPLTWCRFCHSKHSDGNQPEKKIGVSKIRNIGVMAHIDAGKTTTTERMLYYSGFSRRLGTVDDGDTVMDYMDQERDRGITITSAAITFNWAGHKVNLIDTPGHVDFTVEVDRSLRVLDGAVAVLDASAGVEAQTLTVWRQANRYNIPRLVFLNKMDKPAASMKLCLRTMQEKLHCSPLVLNLPIGSGKTFKGVHDLIAMETLVWDSKDGGSFTKTPINVKDDSAFSDSILKARSNLIGQLADLDEHIADLVLYDTDVTDISASDLHAAIRRVTLSQAVVPVLCGSSLKNKGVQPLLDAVCHYLPSPDDRDNGFVRYYSGHLCALAFKVQFDKKRGHLTFLRIYSGALKSGATVYNINRQQKEKTTRILQVYADELKDVPTALAGNIVAVSGLKNTITGDTITLTKITAQKAAHNHWVEMNLASGIHVTETVEDEYEVDDNEGSHDHLDSDLVPILAGMNVPEPVFFCSVEAYSVLAQQALDVALANLTKEDPSLRVEINPDTGQTVLSGMGELHLDIIQSRLKGEYKLDVDLGPLEIAYREAVTEPASAAWVIDQQFGGKQQFVDIELSLAPDPDSGIFKGVILDSTDNEQPEALNLLKPHLRKAIDSGVRSALSSGCLLHFPVIQTAVSLHKFRKKYGTTLPMITAAAAMATTKALKEAQCGLLEPVMAMEVTTDEDKVDSVLGDLGQRRSHILNTTTRHGARVIEASTPLQALVGYSTALRTITSGTGSCSIELSHYVRMSQDETQKVIDRKSGFSY